MLVFAKKINGRYANKMVERNYKINKNIDEFSAVSVLQQNEIISVIKSNMNYKLKDGNKIYDIPKYNFKVSLNIQGISKESFSYYLLLLL